MKDVVVQSKRTWISQIFSLARDIGPVSSKAEHRAFYAVLGFGHDLKKPPNFTKLAMALNLTISSFPKVLGSRSPNLSSEARCARVVKALLTSLPQWIQLPEPTVQRPAPNVPNL